MKLKELFKKEKMFKVETSAGSKTVSIESLRLEKMQNSGDEEFIVKICATDTEGKMFYIALPFRSSELGSFMNNSSPMITEV